MMHGTTNVKKGAKIFKKLATFIFRPVDVDK
jgi:hypothetical protein